MAVLSNRKKSELIIYWVDTGELLAHHERKELEFWSVVISVTPTEILLEDSGSGRKVAVVAASKKRAKKVVVKN